MNFFDTLINDTLDSLAHLPCKAFKHNSKNAWSDVGYNQVILQRDSAYELDGTGFSLVTASPVEDSVMLVGEDISEMGGNRKFARITVLEIDDADDENQQKTYNLLKKIEYVKYHFFPEGYMIRTSSRSHKEVVRVSKKSAVNGMSFEKIGNLLINKYKQLESVKGVRVIFVTDKSADYSLLSEFAQKNSSITQTLNHVMNSVNFDCSTCNLKPICDEVEGMKELHFKKNSSM